jgi:hypothetical protein
MHKSSINPALFGNKARLFENNLPLSRSACPPGMKTGTHTQVPMTTVGTTSQRACPRVTCPRVTN